VLPVANDKTRPYLAKRGVVSCLPVHKLLYNVEGTSQKTRTGRREFAILSRKWER